MGITPLELQEFECHAITTPPKRLMLLWSHSFANMTFTILSILRPLLSLRLDKLSTEPEAMLAEAAKCTCSYQMDRSSLKRLVQ